ncbi:MAG: hypothetical protein ACOC1K_07430, partial [Nanoarchaeota archaeon]
MNKKSKKKSHSAKKKVQTKINSKKNNSHKKFKPLHHHIKHHYNTYNSAPPGLKLLITYSVILALLYFILGILFPTTIVFGHELTGPLAQFLNLFFVMVLIVIIYGYIHRRSWVYELAVIWYILSIISSFFSLILWDSEILTSLADSIILLSLFMFAINILNLWYIIVRKKYFKHPHTHLHDTYDKLYIHVMTIFFVLTILIITLIITNFYQKTSSYIDENINDIRGKSLEDALFTCANKPQ